MRALGTPQIYDTLVAQITHLTLLLQSQETSIPPVHVYQSNPPPGTGVQLSLPIDTHKRGSDLATQDMFSPDAPTSPNHTNVNALLSDFEAELARAGVPCPILPGLLRLFHEADDLFNDPAFAHIHKIAVLQALRNDRLLPRPGETAEQCVSHLLTQSLGGYIIPTSRLFRKLNSRGLEPNTDYLDPKNVHCQVPGFTLKAHIGSGGHAFIYLATNNSTGEEVVIKIGVQDRIPLSGLSNEFRFQADPSLQHAARAYEMGKTRGGFPYLVLKFYKKKHLSALEFISNFSLAQRIPLLRKMIVALAEAHSFGIIHSDIKMANIFWDEEWNAYLGDFGIASSKGQDTLYRFSFSGTQTFMAPEFLNPKEIIPVHLTKDTYSLGILLIILLRKDFIQITSHQHAMSVIKHSDFNAATIDFLNKCIATDPKDRFQNAQECLAAFDQVTFGYEE